MDTKSVINQPIGIFDSGIGGLNILLAIRNQLPNESIIYYADTANCPYGSKTKEEIIALSENITEYLLNNNCKAIVIACNTATGAAISHLRQKYSVPFIGIEPATKIAAEQTLTGNIGILATEHTFQTDHFINTKNQHAHSINVHIQPGIGLVEQVENNQINSEKTRELLKNYVDPLLEKNIDTLVLGCTHYPFLISEINKIVPQKIKIIDPSEAIAKQLNNVLLDDGLLNSTKNLSKYNFASSGDLNNYKKQIEGFINFNHSILS